MINKVILIGNLGRDPEVRKFENGSMVAKFPIATNENYRDKNGEWQQITEWHDIVCWRGLAERAERNLKKGSLVFIEGKLSHRKYQDQNGIDRYVTEVVANTFRQLDKKDSSLDMSMPGPSDKEYSQTANSPSQESTSTRNSGSTQESNLSDDQFDDDLPF